MKLPVFVSRLIFAPLVGIVLAGCLLNPVTVSTRHFVLAPISTNEPAPITMAAPAQQLSVGLGFVKMPSYLLRNSLAIRNGANEIQYIEDARWGERLDQSFQRTMAANLSRLLPSDSIYLSDWGRDQVTVKVSIAVQQFDVDTHGHGTLIAQWRITAPDNDTPLKIGRAQFDRTGPSSRHNPGAVVATMSDLAADFSRGLAQSIRESTKRIDNSLAATANP